MADASTPVRDHPAGKKGFIGKTLDLIFKVIGILLFSAAMSILIEWGMMILVYSGQGYSHAESMMKNEISYLGSSLRVDDSNNSMINSASNRVSDVVDFVFIDSGVLDALSDARTISPEDGRIKSFIKSVVQVLYDYIIAAIYILIMFSIRLSILILSTPVFILFGLVGICDGLMKRDLRRWCGGNESGFIYHWAKRFSFPVLVATWIIYLALPMSIHPNLIIMPFAVLFALVLMIMSSKFKKYL